MYLDEKTAVKIWSNACEELQKNLSELTFRTWISKVEPFIEDDNTFILSTPNSLTSEFLKDYVPSIQEALFTVSSNRFNVRCEINAAERLRVQQQRLNEANLNSMNTPESNRYYLNPSYTFDSFVVGSGNRFAHAAASAVSSLQGGKSYNPLFLYGGSGLGKTHLIQAIGNAVLKDHPDKRVMYVNTEQFVNDFIQVIKTGLYDGFRNRYRYVDILLMDDIQFLEKKEQMQEEFFHTFNALNELGKKIVLTCDKPPQSLTTLEDRLRTRMASGLIIDISPPDYETRMAILSRLAQMNHVEFPEEVLEYVATNVTRNIRELEGAFKNLRAYSLINPVTMENCNLALREYLVPQTKKKVDAALIMSLVANFYNVTVDDLKSQLRSQDVVLPRQVAMYLCRKQINQTFTEIGELFGKRNHATVMYAYNKISADIETDPKLEKNIKDICLRITT